MESQEVNIEYDSQYIEIDGDLINTAGGGKGNNGGDPKTKIADVRRSFQRNKKSIDKMFFTMYVDQPKAGSRNTKNIGTIVGHTFMSLQVLNKDGSMVSQVFGFYPEGSGGNPFVTTSESSTFKDNRNHDYDESVSIEINASQFESILKTAEKFESQQYDLCTRNCSSFALAAAQISGIEISETYGYWALGTEGGNNPASVGQSILEGKVKNKATGNKDGLFIDVGGAKKAMEKSKRWF
jgi:hypothetical protein